MSGQGREHILEEDLFRPVCDLLIKSGYEVRSELQYCDITAVRDDELIIVELKKHLSVDLLIQGVKRQKISDATYIAVPKPKKLTRTAKWRDICHLVRRLELGLILVSFKGSKSLAEIAVEPAPFDRARSYKRSNYKRARLIKEFNGRRMDLNVGGSKGKKLVTAYREQALYIACCMDKLGQLSPKQLRYYGSDQKKTQSILHNDYYGWFSRVSKGLYELTDSGKESLILYDELAGLYRKSIDEIIDKEAVSEKVEV